MRYLRQDIWEVGSEDSDAQDGPHCSLHSLWVPRVNAARAEYHGGKAKPVSHPEDGTGVAGVLDAVKEKCKLRA